MEFIADANEVFSAIISKGRKQQTKKIDIIFSSKVNLYAPTKLFREIEKNFQRIKELTKFSDTDFELFVAVLKLRIKSVQTEYFSDKLPEAKDICPHSKDIPYFALALKLNCPIWSGEKKLKNQSKIEVYNTKELIEKFNL